MTANLWISVKWGGEPAFTRRVGRGLLELNVIPRGKEWYWEVVDRESGTFADGLSQSPDTAKQKAEWAARNVLQETLAELQATQELRP